MYLAICCWVVILYRLGFDPSVDIEPGRFSFRATVMCRSLSLQRKFCDRPPRLPPPQPRTPARVDIGTLNC